MKYAGKLLTLATVIIVTLAVVRAIALASKSVSSVIHKFTFVQNIKNNMYSFRISLVIYPCILHHDMRYSDKTKIKTWTVY